MWFMRVSMDERIGGANAALSGLRPPAQAGLGSASGRRSRAKLVSGAGRWRTREVVAAAHILHGAVEDERA